MSCRRRVHEERSPITVNVVDQRGRRFRASIPRRRERDGRDGCDRRLRRERRLGTERRRLFCDYLDGGVAAGPERRGV